MLAPDAVRIKMNAGSGTEERRIVVLKSGGHFDNSRFDVGDNRDELAWFIAIAGQTIKRANQRDCQR